MLPHRFPHRVRFRRDPFRAADVADSGTHRLGLRQAVERDPARASLATSPPRLLRLVIITSGPGAPGSSGRTCAASAALSRMIGIRRPSSSDRYVVAGASGSGGICSIGTFRDRNGFAPTRRNAKVTAAAATPWSS